MPGWKASPGQAAKIGDMDSAIVSDSNSIRKGSEGKIGWAQALYTLPAQTAIRRLFSSAFFVADSVPST